MRYWWVNQNKTHKEEISGGFLWSPKTKITGGKNPFYDYMKEVEPGDIVFSYFKKQVGAIGIATTRAETSPKPDFGKAGEKWSSEGWLVKVEFNLLENPISPKEHQEKLLHLMPENHAPLKQSGGGKEFYLTSLPDNFATALINLIGPEFQPKVEILKSEINSIELENESVEEALVGRTDIGPTTKSQLVKSRRGQGIFKTNVRLNEQVCRITGVSDTKHLIASHIKPWSESNDEEKLNGCNGLLLAPHVDHLFDRGLISFSDSGDLLISKALDRNVLAAWGIREVINVGTFKPEQIFFLKHHRNKFGF